MKHTSEMKAYNRAKRIHGKKHASIQCPKSFYPKRKLRGKKLSVGELVKARILQSVVKTAASRLDPNPHWYLDPEDWALPTADQGSRRIVYESTVGRVSTTSDVFRTCTDKNCVRPDHCEVENKAYRAKRLAGETERSVVVGNGMVMSQSLFEKELQVMSGRKAWLSEQHDLAKSRAMAENLENDLMPHQHLAGQEHLGALGVVQSALLDPVAE